MEKLKLATAIMFLISGALEVVFAAFSVLGVSTGLMLMVGEVPRELRELSAMGNLLFWLYLVGGLAAGLGAILHLVCGVAMLRGKASDGLLWVATAGSLVPMITVYCAPTSMIAGILGLLVLLMPGGPTVDEAA